MNFIKEIPIDSVHGAVEHRNPGPQFVSHGRMAPSSPELDLRPLWCSRAPAKGNTGSGNPFQASSKGEQWRGSQATRRRSGGGGRLVGARSGVGEEES
jgi:hypothetical protein